LEGSFATNPLYSSPAPDEGAGPAAVKGAGKYEQADLDEFCLWLYGIYEEENSKI
jgi:hypothetical protein